MTTGLANQTGFAFYEDGTESGAAIIGSIDTDISRTVGNIFQIRLEIAVTGMALNIAPSLRYSHEGGAFLQVNGSSLVVQSIASGDLTDDEDTTERLAGPNAFVTGSVDEADGVALTVNVDNSPAENTEILFSITIIDGDVLDLETIDFRLYNVSTQFDSYLVTPRITVDKPPPPTIGYPRALFTKPKTYIRM